MKFPITFFAAAAILAMPACQTTEAQRGFLIQTGTDVGLALLVSETPEFAPYASAVAELIKTRDLTPETLEASFAAYKANEVDAEDAPRVSLILDLISQNYRAYYEARAVPLEPETYAESVAEQLVAEEAKIPLGSK